MRASWIVIAVGVALLGLTVSVRGQEDDHRADEVMRKLKAGAPLDKDEKELLGKLKARGRFFDRTEKEPPIFRPDRLNPIDDAQFAMAEIHMEREAYDRALTALERVAEKSPDKLAVSAAYLNIGEIYRRHIRDAQKAVDAFRKVTGELSKEALKRIVQTYEDAGDAAGMAKALDEMLAQTGDKRQKADILRRIAETQRRAGDHDGALATLQRIAETVTYEDIAEMEKQEGKERGEGDMSRMMEGELGKLRKLRQLGRHGEAEDVRRAARGRLEERIRHLEETGQAENAERARKWLKALNEDRGDAPPLGEDAKVKRKKDAKPEKEGGPE
ncbi:MAG: tetratricopeptide repeat protein [Planctomycetes bacterium]|nr:tetratricopeptide repeat protein [Planctomycetota bacterium]